MSAMTDLQTRRAHSLRILQTIQKNALEILHDTSYVALYRFLEDDQRWIRMDIEGSSFITRNSDKPAYSLIILNKIGDQDLVLQIEEDILKVRVQDKYVMMKCLHSEGRVIFGLWFHDQSERQRTFDTIQQIIANKTTTSSSNPSLRRINISSILSPNKPAEDGTPKEQSGPPMASSSTKSSQLLSLLRRGSNAENSVGNGSTSASPTNLPPELSVSVDATAKLKSVLFASPDRANSTQSQPAAPVPSAPATPAAAEPTDKTRMLLALVRGTSAGGQALTGVSTPARAIEASSGAELLTDGDIARKLHALTVKPGSTSPSPAQFEPTPAHVAVHLSAAASAAPSVPKLASTTVAPPTPAAGSAGKPVKKPSVKLISPSDLEAF